MAWRQRPGAIIDRHAHAALLFTDPGGSLTTFIINKANRSTIPDLFEVLRKQSQEPRYRDPQPAAPEKK